MNVLIIVISSLLGAIVGCFWAKSNVAKELKNKADMVNKDKKGGEDDGC